MPKASKFYDIIVSGEVVFHGTFAEAKKVYVAIRKSFSVIHSDAVVTMSFVPNFPDDLYII